MQKQSIANKLLKIRSCLWFQKPKPEYNKPKSYKCPVAWGIVCLRTRRFSPPPAVPTCNPNNGGQDHDTYASIVPL